MKKYIIPILIGLSITSVASGYVAGFFVLDSKGNGQKILPVPQIDGLIPFTDSSRPSGINWRDPSLLVNPVELLLAPGFVTWTNQPATITELVGYREQYNFTNASKARIVVGINATGTGNIGVQYFNGSWLWIDGASNASGTESQPDIISLSSKGLQNTAWFNLPNLNDVILRVVGFGGDGVADPQISNLRLQVR